MSAIGPSGNVMICPKCHSDFVKAPKPCPLGCRELAGNCKMVWLRPVLSFAVEPTTWP